MNTKNIRMYGEVLKQGSWPTMKDAMNKDGQMCVEGRLCDIMQIGTWVKPFEHYSGRHLDLLLPDGTVCQNAAPSVMFDVLLGSVDYKPEFYEAIGTIVKQDPRFENTDYQSKDITLMVLNDHFDLTVQEIGELLIRVADYLETTQVSKDAEAFLRRSREANYAI